MTDDWLFLFSCFLRFPRSLCPLLSLLGAGTVKSGRTRTPFLLKAKLAACCRPWYPTSSDSPKITSSLPTHYIHCKNKLLYGEESTQQQHIIPTISTRHCLLHTTTKMFSSRAHKRISSATNRDREDESLPLPTGHHTRRNKMSFDFTFAGRPFTSLRTILTVGGLVLLVSPLLVLNLRTDESLYQSQGRSGGEGKFFFISCLLILMYNRYILF